MSKVKFLSVFVLAALLLSAMSGAVRAHEPPLFSSLSPSNPDPLTGAGRKQGGNGAQGSGVMASALVTPSLFAELPDFQEASLQEDPELALLVEKYEALVRTRSLTSQELAELIASDKSEKAKFLGIRESVEYTPADFYGGTVQSLGVCVRPIWGPGKVVWNFNPGQNGAKYSVLPESGNSLIWAQPPEQAIDGIYRANWGNCTAYKIPDSATATFSSAESWEVCYNTFACQFMGHCPKWVNPCDNNSPEGSWPDHPLQ